jgi:hypothetical protein
MGGETSRRGVIGEENWLVAVDMGKDEKKRAKQWKRMGKDEKKRAKQWKTLVRGDCGHMSTALTMPFRPNHSD